MFKYLTHLAHTLRISWDHVVFHLHHFILFTFSIIPPISLHVLSHSRTHILWLFGPIHKCIYFKCVHFNVVWSDVLPYGCSKHIHVIYPSPPSHSLWNTCFTPPHFSASHHFPHSCLHRPMSYQPLSVFLLRALFLFLVLCLFFFDDLYGYLKLKTQI